MKESRVTKIQKVNPLINNKTKGKIYLLHCNDTTFKNRTVQILDAAISLANSRHCNKPKSARFPCPWINHQMNIYHLKKSKPLTLQTQDIEHNNRLYTLIQTKPIKNKSAKIHKLFLIKQKKFYYISICISSVNHTVPSPAKCLSSSLLVIRGDRPVTYKLLPGFSTSLNGLLPAKLKNTSKKPLVSTHNDQNTVKNTN